MNPLPLFRQWWFKIAFITFSLAIGIKLILKYQKHKEFTLLSVGLTWIFISSFYWGFTFSFLSILLFNYQFEHALFLFLSYGFVPIATICWFYSFCRLYNLNKFKLIFYPIFMINMALFVIQLVLILLNYEIVAIHIETPRNPFQYQRQLILYLTALQAFLLILISGTLFCMNSLESKNPSLIWKGRFLLVGFYTFGVGTLIDIFSFGNLTLQIVARILLIIASFFYYLGFFLPPGIAKILIKE